MKSWNEDGSPLTRVDLDSMRCEAPGCKCNNTELVFRGQCHFDAPTFAVYNSKTGILTIECAECDKPIARVQVAEGPGSSSINRERKSAWDSQ